EALLAITQAEQQPGEMPIEELKARRARLEARFGDRELAERMFQDLLRRSPNNARIMAIRAKSLAALGQLEAALDVLARAVKMAPSDRKLRRTYTQLLIEADRFGEA